MEQLRRARIEIDLAALQHNAAIAKQHANVASVMAAIKANAYGHGILVAAKALQSIVDEFAVASMDDVLAIRQNVPECMKKPITVLSGFYSKEEVTLAAKHQATLVVYDAQQIDMLYDAVPALQRQNQNVQIWFKIDTGMSRLGLTVAEFETGLIKLELIQQISIRGVISHFANADVPADALNQTQLDRFEQLRQKYSAKLWQWSLANSAAILAEKASEVGIHYDWVRPGIMLYGSSPFGHSSEKTATALGLQAVMSLKSHVISVRKVLQGQSVGYGSTWTAESDTDVAVIACGYGDGYPRAIQPNTPILIDGQRTRILGRVSMDLIVVDLTDINAVIGSEVELWGKNISVDEIAHCAGTIGYELLCNITQRVERIHLNGKNE